jgi:thiamine-phosphate pyrophosphorylase
LISINKPIVCYVTDRASLGVAAGVNREEALLERVRGAAAAGVDWIELREKDLDTRTLLDLTRKALSAARAACVSGRESMASPRLLINDRLDVARAAGAGGVHLTEASAPVRAVAQWKREGEFLIGASCHSLEGAQCAAANGADYIFFGPVFATRSKAAFGAPQGPAKLAAICRAVKIPVLAIGGITIENAAACVEAGAAGIAAIALFQQASDLCELLAELRERLG